MPLAEGTVRPLVDEWAASAPTTFTDAEAAVIAERLVAISAQVTAHVVPDVVLADDRLQAYLLARVTGRLEDWLAGAAAGLRESWGIDALRLTADGSAPALGLRGATEDELVALPGVDRVLAREIGRFVAQAPGLTSTGRLIDVEGIGPDRLADLESAVYLDAPRLGLASPALLAFVLAPEIVAFLRVLERTDLAPTFGDGSALMRRSLVSDRSPAARFTAFLDLMLEQATRSSSVAAGVLASEAERWLERHELRRTVLAGLVPADGGVLVNDAYLEATLSVIEGAATSVHLMVFLGTATGGTDLAPAPLALVEAMEAAAARGVTVRAILDQDDGGEPFRSLFINRPLVERFAAGGVAVKFDEEDTLLHSKVLVADRRTAVVGSHNWTRSALQETHELSVLVDSPGVAAQFDDRFQTLWDSLPAL